jgi:hypothetical protein
MSAVSIPQSDLEAKLTINEQQRLRRQVDCAITNAQDKWLDGVMRKLLPRKLYRMVRENGDRAKAFEWLDRNDIRIVQQGSHIQQIFRGKELLSTFVVKLADK